MGLIKSGIYAGTAYAIFNQATKAYGAHERNHNEQQRQYQPQQMQFQPPTVQRGGSPVNASQYIHQHYCNGQCGGQCNPVANSASQIQGSTTQCYGGNQQQRQIEQENLPVYESNNMNQNEVDGFVPMAQKPLKK